ncbi:MAG: hypothetical protein J6M05_03645 [Cardiobacteriaceae bacterium]|nr:hypothetical protein [Cardiobacteriaceae bacterium]
MQNLMSVEELKNNLEAMGEDISTPMFIGSEDEIKYVLLDYKSFQKIKPKNSLYDWVMTWNPAVADIELDIERNP